MNRRRALLVDLNNFGGYPTLAIGYLVAALRGSDYDVEVLSPLAYGVPAHARELRETRRHHLQRRVYFSTHPAMVRSHDRLRDYRASQLNRPHPLVLEQTRRALDERRPDVLLLSAYLDHHPSVEALGSLAEERGVPLMLGGPMFNVPEVAREWLQIPGLTALVGAEVDHDLPSLVDALLDGDDLSARPGVFLPDGREGPPAAPLQNLDTLPPPDFADFPWARYPTRVVPVMATRGCGWGRCMFCSDVITANGRTFRSRTANVVLDEVVHQAERYGTRDFIFLDIKLNSDLQLWRALIDSFQDRLAGGRWIGTVHVGARGDNGLSRDDLRAAYAAGMTRTTFGLETGSQRVNDSMAKGTRLERSSEFLEDASEAGISVRATAMLGYPGERAEDVDGTVRFIEEHEHCFDRLRLARFKPIPGTRFHARHDRRPEDYSDLTKFSWNFRLARADYRYGVAESRLYRRSKARLLNAIYRINRKQLRASADAFDGLL